MCISPSFIWVQRGPGYQKQPVACRQCWRCKRNRVNDYVGRCLAEAATSEWVVTLTLTYAPRDDLADKVLHPRHFQLFMKRLRKLGHEVRYFVAGEYGSLRGRAHFHCILFFNNSLPALSVPFYNPEHLSNPQGSASFSRGIPGGKKMVHVREWPHGHVAADLNADERALRYVCKYLLKEDKQNCWFSMSKKPPLGAEWFARKAAVAVELGTVLPSSFDYLPPGGDRAKPYYMTGATRRDYLNAITTDPRYKAVMSEWVLKSFEKHERKRIEDALNAQPAAALIEAFLEARQRTEYHQAVDRRAAEREFAEYLRSQLEAAPSHILRPYGAEWIDDGEWRKRMSK